jgi:hypothetical protein
MLSCKYLQKHIQFAIPASLAATVYPQIYNFYCLPQEVKELLGKLVQKVNMNRTYGSFCGDGGMWTD